MPNRATDEMCQQQTWLQLTLQSALDEIEPQHLEVEGGCD